MNMFSFDSPLMNFLTKAAEFMITCVLCLVCSLPVFTIGAAVTAKYYIGMRYVRGEDTPVFRAYFRSFRDNFAKATKVWLIELVIVVFLAFDWYTIINGNADNYTRLFKIILLVISILLVMIILAGFAILARFEMTVMEAIKGAFTYVCINLPRMIFIVILTVAPTIAGYRYPNWLMAIWPIGSAMCLYVICYQYVRSFRKLEATLQTQNDQES